MYLFTRAARLGPGNTRASQSWAGAVTEKVNQISSLQISLWTPIFSAGVGTLVWSAMSEDLQAFDDTDAKLQADDGFAILLDEGAQYLADQPIDDALLSVVYPGCDATMRPDFVASVRARVVPGRFGRGVELGIEIAKMAEKITGLPTLFGVSAAGGDYGAVSWLSGYHTLSEMQHAEESINTSAEFVTFLDREVKDVYEGAAQGAARRLM